MQIKNKKHQGTKPLYYNNDNNNDNNNNNNDKNNNNTIKVLITNYQLLTSGARAFDI